MVEIHKSPSFLPFGLFACDNRLAVGAQQRREARRAAVSVKYVVDAGFRVCPDFHDVNGPLGIYFLKAIHKVAPYPVLVKPVYS